MPKQTPGGFHWFKASEIENTGQNFGLGRAQELQELTSRDSCVTLFLSTLSTAGLKIRVQMQICANRNFHSFHTFFILNILKSGTCCIALTFILRNTS